MQNKAGRPAQQFPSPTPEPGDIQASRQHPTCGARHGGFAVARLNAPLPMRRLICSNMTESAIDLIAGTFKGEHRTARDTLDCVREYPGATGFAQAEGKLGRPFYTPC